MISSYFPLLPHAVFHHQLALCPSADYHCVLPAERFNHRPLLATMDIQYKIIGGDGVEYGPAPLAELKNWIRDGRVAAMTKVWRSDLSIWSPADRYTELLEELARLNASVAATADRALPPAGFWVRLAAFMIDFVLLLVLFVAVWTPIAGPRHWQIPD